MIGTGQLDEASAELDNLSQYPYLFPTLSADKEGLRRMRIDAAMTLGAKNLDQQQFDAAQPSVGIIVKFGSIHLGGTLGNSPLQIFVFGFGQ